MSYKKSANDVLNFYSKTLNTTSRNLDSYFNCIVELILNCQGRTVVSGIGKSGLVGQKMVATFASTGTPSFFLHPTEAFHGDLGMLKPSDVVILISYSGETDDVNKLIPSLKSFGNKIIAMTGNLNSTLAKHADYILDISVEREACPNNLAPTTSTLVTMALGDCLAIALINARNFRPEDFAWFHPGGSLGRKLLCRVKDVMQKQLPIVHLSATFQECLFNMTENKIGVTLVMEENNLKGIITDGDIRRMLASKGVDSFSLLAKDLMTAQPKTISENAYIGQAEELMREHRIHSLVVITDNNRVSGIFEFSS